MYNEMSCYTTVSVCTRVMDAQRTIFWISFDNEDKVWKSWSEMIVVRQQVNLVEKKILDNSDSVYIYSECIICSYTVKCLLNYISLHFNSYIMSRWNLHLT